MKRPHVDVVEEDIKDNNDDEAAAADVITQEDDQHKKLELLKATARPMMRLKMSASATPHIKLLVCGYFGDHADMTAQTMEHMTRVVIDIVQNTWKIPWSQVTWISLAGTWMNAIPLALMQTGLGNAIEFYLPCEWSSTRHEDGQEGSGPNGLKKRRHTGPSGSNNDAFIFKGSNGFILKRSMDHMQRRLAETQKVKLCEVPHLSAQMFQCAEASQAVSMFKCDDFVQQRVCASRTATHVIHLPHLPPTQGTLGALDIGTKAYNDAYYKQGGKCFEDAAPTRRAQVEVYQELRNNGLGSNAVYI